jgi:Flp pilus assembly protein TadG
VPSGRHASTDRPRGQVLVLFALSLTALIAIAGLVVDLGGSWAQSRSQQKVADMAALAGATKEANGGLKAEIIQAALDSAAANGYSASEVTVNIPPTTGAYAPGGSQSGPLSTNDCSATDKFPCWIEVSISRPHGNSFSRVLGMNSFPVTARGVTVGGIANAVSNGVAPIMFNYKSVKKYGSTETTFCDPEPSKCPNNSAWPTDQNQSQFAWTTFCVTATNCNVDSNTAKDIIDGGNFQFTVSLSMYLGPHNQGQKTSVCHELLDAYPNGADLSVAINDDNGNLVGWWVWHLDTANSDCEGKNGEQLAGWFVQDTTSTLPLTIIAGGGKATFGQPVVKLVE